MNHPGIRPPPVPSPGQTGPRMVLPEGARQGARKPFTYGVRKKPHVRFSFLGNVSEAQQRMIRNLAETLGVDPAELVGE